ncbi:non-heme iron oxygenase ferredoxin subunit [Humibacter sp.]|uniref:non-heme iron oxygenase ferredoxin subunit n=1 Tax=Humibacter sp. TaxID=1940291 RepID=UPI003F7E0525
MSAKVCREAELSSGLPFKAMVDGIPVIIVKDADGRLHALGDTCSHAEISLSEGFVEGGHIECWAHGATFDLATGRPLSLPATDPVPVFGVDVVDGDVLVTVDDAEGQR